MFNELRIGKDLGRSGCGLILGIITEGKDRATSDSGSVGQDSNPESRDCKISANHSTKTLVLHGRQLFIRIRSAEIVM